MTYHSDAGCSYVLNQEGPDYEYEHMIESERSHVWKTRCRFCEHFDDPDRMSRKYLEQYYSEGVGWNPFCNRDVDDTDGLECLCYKRRA
jgi:hypothetical protein